MSDVLATPLRLTAVALLLRPMGAWYVRPAILALACAVLVSSRALRSQAVWGALAALVALRIAGDWPLADNHIYLLGYWCLAVALAVESPNAAAILVSSSRMLVGLAFALAVLWKGVLAPDFLDGRFFRVTLMTDPRFQEASMLIGGLSRSELASNAQALAALPEGAEPIESPDVLEPTRMRAFAAVSTWGILALEACVAVAMLAPLPSAGWATALRHGTLLAFCLVTYALAPVAGFGWLLLVMGLAQSGGRPGLTGLYVSAFLLVLFYTEVPWAALMLQSLGK